MSDLSIRLSEKQKVIQQELKAGVDSIESAIQRKVYYDNGHAIAELLADLSSLAAYSPRLMEIATFLRGVAHGALASEIMDNKDLLNAKQELQKMYISGRLKEYNAMFARTEEACKKLDKHLDYLRSLLSWEKEKLNKRVGQE